MYRFTVMANEDCTYSPMAYYPSDDSTQCVLLPKMSYIEVRDLSRMLSKDCVLELRSPTDEVLYEGVYGVMFRRALNDHAYQALKLV